MAGLNLRGRRVFLTGHTGFKGSWCARVLLELGAEVTGYALAPDTQPNHFDLLKLPIESVIADIRDHEKLTSAMKRARPDLVLHMAAQPLVLRSYDDPRETYETNVMGTLNVLEAVRATPSVRAAIVVTSDKCYENREASDVAYRESDPMGGYDPYSSSKGCTELLTASYRRSFFGSDDATLIASVRAGNVLGGGDWSPDRLLPDFARAFAAGEKVVLRNTSAVRPWQHVLEPVCGYLHLAQRLLEGRRELAKGWNFGPERESCWSVQRIVDEAKKHWPSFQYEVTDPRLHEAKFLMLDSTMAKRELGWSPKLKIEETLAWTLDWYEAFVKRGELTTTAQIQKYLN